MAETGDEPAAAVGAVADTDEAAIEAGRLLFARECRFIAGAADIGTLPDADLIEVAFAGRSNVGKSSLVNALTGRRTLARISHTPGRTQQINFFLLGEALFLVDLPGFGYARVSKTKVRQWTQLVNDYLRGRVTLRRLCLLIDSRHGPKDVDREVMAMLDVAAVSYQVVLTKADKTSAGELARVLDATRSELVAHPAAHPDVVVTSARTGAGIEHLRAILAALVDDVELG